MGEPLVSVIVPVYNVEAYLARCVASLRGQTYPDLEIILVDDGSADGSGLLCDSFAREDPRIRVIHQPNAGVSAARNAGLEAASGSYVCFVDGDDWAEETMAAEAAVAADTPQPQVAESLPVKSLMYTFSAWERARARSGASVEAFKCRASSTTGSMAVMPWLPLPALLMMGNSPPLIRTSDAPPVA